MEASRTKVPPPAAAVGPAEPARGKNNFFDDSHDDDFSSYFKKNKTSNPFDEDEDDADFMSTKKPVSGKSGVRSSNPYATSAESPEENVLSARDLYVQEVKAIQERTLDTTSRSLRLIDESEAVGVAAAQELLAQREQLQNASNNLDNMNSTLDQSQKHINSIKSVFGGIKNWWTSKPASVDSSAAAATDTNPKLRELVDKNPSGSSAPRQTFGPEANSPYRPTSDYPAKSATGGSVPKTSYDAALDSNLDHMTLGLSRLKGLAEGLGGEIEVQNKLLDSMNSKTERVDMKIGEQQKHMDKILGKKK